MSKSFKLKNTYLDSRSISYNRQPLNEIINGKDYTNQLTFTNCIYNSGKVMKFGKIVMFNLSVKSTITNAWGILLKIPREIYPIRVHDDGVKISNYWVYGLGASNGSGNLKGEVEANKNYVIVGCYICDE